MKKKKLSSVEVNDAVLTGEGIARHEGMVVMISGAVPGDVVDVTIVKKKKNYLIARLNAIRKASPERVEPFCGHFGLCGGCTWQHLSYSGQLRMKQKHVTDVFQRIGKVAAPEAKPIIGSEKKTHYRNRLEFTCSAKRWLDDEEIKQHKVFDRNAIGFHLPGRFNRIIDLQQCYLQPEPSNRIRLAVKRMASELGLTYYDPEEHRGFLRNILIRTSETGDVLVLFVFNEEEPGSTASLLGRVQEEFGEITSMQYLINQKLNDTYYDCPTVLFSGSDHLTELLGGLRFKVNVKSFFQTNTKQAEMLCKVVMEFAALKGTELVYDLYSGIGALSLQLAGKAEKVVGIESVAEAVDDARSNAELNNIHNTAFICSDVRKISAEELTGSFGHPDLVVTDPPRAGMHADVISLLLELAAKRIVYVSCNPATQARDIALLSGGYKMEQIQPIDLFPHTHHVENVALLRHV